MSNGLSHLSAEDRQLIHELFTASRQLDNTNRECMLKRAARAEPCQPPNLNRVLTIIERNYRRGIEMCKNLSAFAHLGQFDQITLVKGGVNELIFLRNVHNYDAERRAFRPRFAADPTLTQDDRCLLSIDRMALVNPIMSQLFIGFMRTFDPDWAADLTLMLLLMAIVLYNPLRENLVQVQEIRVQNDKYKAILSR